MSIKPKYFNDYKVSNISAMIRNNRRDPKICTDDFKGRLVVISGATSGVGYLTAKKLAQLFREMSFSEWKSKLDSGGETVVMRSGDESEFDPYRRSLEMLGVETEVIDQKVIGGAKVF